MGNLFSRALYGWRNWYVSYEAERCEKAVADAVAKHLLAAKVLEAIKTGDAETLKNLQEESNCLFYGYLDFDQHKPLLFLATTHGHIQIVRYLLQFDVDVDATDNCGMSALHEACKHNRHECLSLLLPASRHIDKRDVWGRTPLMKAVVYRNVTAANLLLQKGADPNISDNYGMTALSTAIDYNMMDIVRMLVSHGADLNLITRHNHQCSGPPLYRAIHNQNLAMVKELLLLGAKTHPTQPLLQQRTLWANTAWANLSYAQAYLGESRSATPTLQHDNAVHLAMSELVKRNDEFISLASLDILMEVLSAHGYTLGSQPDVLARVIFNNRHSRNFSWRQSRDDGRPHGRQQGILSRPDLSTASQSSSTQPPSSYSSLSEEDVKNMLLLKLYLCSCSTHEASSLESLASRAEGRISFDNNNVSEERNFELEPFDIHQPLQVDDVVNFPLTGIPRLPSHRLRRQRRAVPQDRNVVSLHTQARRVARRSMMASGRNVIWSSQRLSIPPALKTLLLLGDIDRAYTGFRIKTNL